MNPIVDVAGWTLMHFVWQGTAVALLAAAVMRLLRHASPQARYLTTCAALAAMVIAPLVTARLLSQEAPSTRAVVASSPGGHGDAGRVTSRTSERGASEPSPPGSIAPLPAALAGVTVRTLLPSVVALWLAGVGALLVRLAGGWWRVRSLHRRSLAGAASRWHASGARLATQLGLRRQVRVVDSPDVDTPLVVGWLRPVILLPIAALTNLTPAQVDAILAHELAHVRRHDFAVNLLQTLAETALFYHPAVWWVSARIRAEREHCCDAVAVEVSGDPLGYAEALTELETWRTQEAGFALAVTSGPLVERVRRVLGLTTDRPAILGAPALVFACVVLFVGIAGVQYLRAAQPVVDGNAAATPSADSATKAWRMVFDHPSGELSLKGFTGRDLIRFAFDVPAARVVGGPRWLDDESLDLSAHLDTDPGADGIQAVVRHILELRMGLTTHIEKREFPAYALVPAGGPSPGLRQSTRACVDVPAWLNSGNQLRNFGARRPCGSWQEGFFTLNGVSVTMSELANEIEQTFRGSLDGLDVLDRTGLTGTFDIQLQMSPLLALANHFHIPGVQLPGIRLLPAEMQDQLGVTIERTAAPYDVVVIGNVHHPN